MGKYKTLVGNSLYTFIGQIGSKTVTLIMLPFYTKWLSVEDYGITDIITIYASLIVCIATLSIHEAIFVFPVNKPLEKQKEYFSTSLFSSVVSVFFVFVVFIALKYIGNSFVITNSFFDNLWYIAVLFVTTYFQTFSQQFCRGINQMQTFCFSGIIVTVFTALLAFLFIPSYGIYGYILSISVANLVGIIYTFISIKINKYVSIKSVGVNCWSELVKYSIPLIPNAILWWIISALNRLFLESSIGIESIGIFAVANKFPGIAAMLLAIFNNSWQISVLQEYGEKGFDEFFNKISKIYIPLIIILSALLGLFCEDTFKLFVDDKFYEGWHYSLVMCTAVVGMNGSGFYGSVFSAVKQSKYYLYSSIVGGFVAVILNVFLIPIIGLWGATLSFALSHLSIWIVRIYYSKKFVKCNNLWLFISFFFIEIIIIIEIINGYKLIAWMCFLLLVSLYCLVNREFFIKVRVLVDKFR